MTSPLAWRSAAPLLLLLLVAASALADLATPCDESLCVAPNCRCSSTATPGGLLPADIPHFVVLTWDDNIQTDNHQFYRELQTRTNPNGCPIEMTFYVMHTNTDYTLVNDLYVNGNEIAVHTVTHSDADNYWLDLTEDGWLAEVQQQMEMLEIYGKVPADQITGFRAPYLDVGGDAMFGALQAAGLEYDCTWPSYLYTPWTTGSDGSVTGALWPYSLDYSSIQEAYITPPTQAFPGFWEAPMTDMLDNSGAACAMLDGCLSANGELDTSAAALTDMLTRNFLYSSDTRAPFGIYTHYYWFYEDIHRQGLEDFLDSLAAYPEVYVVSVRQLLDWVKNPVPLSQLGTLASFQCPAIANTDCTAADNVSCFYQAPLPISVDSTYFNICQGPCPANYPYLNNVDGSLPWS